MSERYIHSVAINLQRCRGCIHCIRHCPTEAMRVRNGKSLIIPYRCIDCGECIRVCPYHAPFGFTHTLDSIAYLENVVVIISPEFYSQFPTKYSIGDIQEAVRKATSAKEVWDTTYAIYLLESALLDYVNSSPNLPLISTYCPAIIELIQVRFPTLIPNLAPFKSPVEIMSQIIREHWQKDHPGEGLNLVYITPCPALASYLKEIKEDTVEFIIGIDNIYLKVKKELQEANLGVQKLFYPKGILTGTLGGEAQIFNEEEAISVGGIDKILRVLEDLERNKIQDVKFLELRACEEGCVGGVLNPESYYLAKKRIYSIYKALNKGKIENSDLLKDLSEMHISRIVRTSPISPRPVWKLDEDISKALKKMDEMKRILEILPGLDCGSCGSPTCASLAEDIVRGNAQIYDCIFLLKEKLWEMAKEMEELSRRSSSVILKRRSEDNEGQ
ncbi:[Fe-Fe] hydrogenase large subunit C-terminal domain-containing protein [Dictyoglomus thermophilum]|uniref:Ferredoxin 2 n=2 Tax=Dictyoglomus thermophilum TaxID=14 RepID=B5YDM0_DICT6|nr:[Fe-Fe] hydrogenase large subunit C-terminal domain-containing protein [Dictyoglomus thermophilum]ACI18849.1 ferredoxin 2 [Dictyoglomus thermophilum H-6-12]